MGVRPPLPAPFKLFIINYLEHFPWLSLLRSDWFAGARIESSRFSRGLSICSRDSKMMREGTSAQVPDFVVPKQAQLVFQFSQSEFTRMGRFPACLLISGGRFRPAETLRPLGGQPVAVLVEIHQRKARAQPLMVLTYAPVVHLGKSEDALQNAERMLHFGSNSRLSRVFAPGIFILLVLVSSSAASHVLRLRIPEGFYNSCALSLYCQMTAAISFFRR